MVRASALQAEGPRFEPATAHHPNLTMLDGCGCCCVLAQISFFIGMPRSMTTHSRLCPIHSSANGLLLRVDVSLGDVHIAVASQVCQRPGVHVRCPPGEAGVSQRIQLKSLKLGLPVLSRFPQSARGLGDRLKSANQWLLELINKRSFSLGLVSITDQQLADFSK